MNELQIVRLTVENFKRIEAVEIQPSGDVVILGGDNEQGKTSVLDAIMATLCGQAAVPPVPVHRGADKGSVTIDLGEVVVRRTFTPDRGGALRIEAKLAGGGTAQIKSPQTWLSERMGALGFDPMEFFHAKPAEQAKTLRNLVGLDTSVLDADRAKLYDERTIVNRQARDAAGQVAGMPVHPDAPAEIVTTAGLQAELDAARQVNAARTKAVADADAADRIATEKTQAVTTTANAGAANVERERGEVARIVMDIERERGYAADRLRDAVAEVSRLEAALVEARAKVEAANEKIRQLDDGVEARRAQARAVVQDAEQRAAAMIQEAERIAAEAAEKARADRAAAEAMPTADEASILARFAEIESINQKVRDNAARQAAAAKVAEYEARSKMLTEAIDVIDAEKAAILARTHFPVAGLGFDPETGGVTFDGLPLEQTSGAQRIRISMAVALAMNPQLRLVLIRDASLLDAKSMTLIRDMAREAGASVWIERVGDADPGAIVIEDGRVRMEKPVQTKPEPTLDLVLSPRGQNPHSRPGGGEYQRD